MSEMKTSHPLALQILLNEELYLIDKPEAAGMAHEAKPEAGEEPLKTTGTKAIPESESPVFDYLGENNRYMLLLVTAPEHKHMPPKELEALQSILQAKKMDLKDVAILNTARHPSLNYQQLKDFFACNSMVLFGVPAELLKINGFPLNKLSDFQGTKVLATYSFADMLSDTDKKRAFWKEMKAL